MNNKTTNSFKFKNPKLDLIKELFFYFGVKYGNLLTILNTHVEIWAIFSLVRFYDSPLRCFTFQDFKLAPTLEEFAHIIGISIKDQVPYTGLGEPPQHKHIASALHMDIYEVLANLTIKGDTCGFSINSLIAKDATFKIKKHWVAFNDFLSLLIYGFVLFPNINDFVDMTTIRIFKLQNLVPTLLDNVYHPIH